LLAEGSPLPAIRASAGVYSAEVVRFDAIPPATPRARHEGSADAGRFRVGRETHDAEG
jgi:hypothetical protein